MKADKGTHDYKWVKVIVFWGQVLKYITDVMFLHVAVHLKNERMWLNYERMQILCPFLGGTKAKSLYGYSSISQIFN